MTFPDAVRSVISKVSRQELTEILACPFAEPIRKRLAGQELDARNRFRELGQRAKQKGNAKCLPI